MSDDELPEGWVSAQVSELMGLVNGFPFKPAQWGKKGLPIIRIQNLNNPDASFNHCTESIPEKFRLRRGDLLFAWSGTPGTSFGAHIWDGGDAWLNQHIFRVEFNGCLIDKRFLRHAINQNLDDYIHQAHGGAGLAHITKGKFESSCIRLSPLAEQHRIVAKVEALLARVNAARQRLAKAPAILKRFRQSVLAAACSGRLTADWREEETVLEPVKESLEGPENVPTSWAWGTFGDLISELRNGIGTKPNPEPPGNPILRISSTRPGRVLLDDIRYLPHSDDLVDVYGLRDGDLLFTRYNGSLDLLGVCGMVRGLGKRTLLYPDKLMRVRIAHGKPLPEYVEAFFGSPQARDRIEANSKSSAGQQGVSGADIKRQPIAVPPLAEQYEIVRRVEALFRLADAIEKRVAAATAQAEKLTQAILAKAFRGELVPTEAELARREGRDYEPAAVLLERIKASTDFTDSTDLKGKKKRRH